MGAGRRPVRGAAVAAGPVVVSRGFAWFLAVLGVLALIAAVVSIALAWRALRVGEYALRGLRDSTWTAVVPPGPAARARVEQDLGRERLERAEPHPPSGPQVLHAPQPRAEAGVAGPEAPGPSAPPAGEEPPVAPSPPAPAAPREPTSRESTAELVRALHHPDFMVRLRAVERARGRPDTEEVLVAALNDDWPIVRREAVRAARGVREVRVVKELIRMVGEDPAAEVREEAVEALGTLLGRRANGS